MPAESKKQQRFFGLVKAIQEGKATGSGKAQEAADSMSEKSVRDYASTSHEDLPEKKSMDPNVAQLLQYAAISAAVGAGGAGLYGLTKYLHDQDLVGSGQGGRLSKFERRISIPKSKKLPALLEAKQNVPVSPSDMTSDAEMEKSDLLPEEVEDMKGPDKAASISQYLGEPALFGAATPLAMLGPGVATFIIGSRLIDQHRKSEMDEKIEQAKKEFEAALSKTSSCKLQEDIDSLYKSADWKDVPDKDVQPSPYGMGFSPSNLAFMAGLSPGVGAALGWYLMSNRMKDDPEKQKLKQLNNLLKRDIASGALSSGLDIEENEEGKPKFKL